MSSNFNPLSPCGERLQTCKARKRPYRFQSTLPMRGETVTDRLDRIRSPISIHSPHAGRDIRKYCIIIGIINFNPLSPCGERRRRRKHVANAKNISIHSPHAGRDAIIFCKYTHEIISIHSPHAGRDSRSDHADSQVRISIHSPHAGRDFEVKHLYLPSYISIHSPHAGRDWFHFSPSYIVCYFNPLSPCGERP